MKKHIHNVILVMSGGIGSRFGADCPKQYSMMGNRMVMDYVMDACRKTKGVDAIVIVASGNYVDFCAKRYSVPTVSGGATRPDSVANGLQYVHDNYDCDKLIITNAVCPLATSEQYQKYFKALDEYDYVLTTWKLAPALHRFDGVRCDRDDFFNVMEPDAYRFKKLYANFDFANKKKYIFHNMPPDSNGYFCMDYPYTMKLTYPHDLKLLEVLYGEIVTKPDQNKTMQVVNHFLTADGKKDALAWIESVEKYIIEFKNRYQLASYAINSQTEENIVYEAYSAIHGDVVIKFTPSYHNFHKEHMYYKHISPGIMAELIDADANYNALVLKMIKPGFQVGIKPDNPDIEAFFRKVNESLIPASVLNGDKDVPNVYDEFFVFQRGAASYTYESQFRSEMERKAMEVWRVYFEDAPKFYLHRDLHRRNLLMSADGIRAIDARGAYGPRAFEYVIQFIIELREWHDGLNREKYDELFSFFSRFVDADELRAALFFFWVYKMNGYVYHKDDGNRLANWCKLCILELFFDGEEQALDPKAMPRNLARLV